MPYTGFGTTSSLGGAEVTTIELAVKVSGQAAVADLDRRLKEVAADIEFQKAALKGGAQTQEEFLDATRKLVAQQTHLTDAVKAANNAMTGTTNKFSNTGQSALQLAYAIDDLQYGFKAIVNNAPQLALAMGGGPGLAGVLGIAFVAVNVLIENMGNLAALFGQGLDARMVNDLKAYQDELKALEGKTVKTSYDYTDIDLMRKKVDDLTEAQAAYQRLVSGKTKTQQEIGKRVSEAIIEHGGGDDYESSAARVVAAMQAVVPAAESDMTARLRQRLAEQEEALRNSAEHNKEVFEHYRDVAKQEVLASVERDRQNQKRAFEEMVGKAAEGKDTSLGFIQGLAEREPEAFRTQGVGPGFLPGLMRARRPRVEEDKARENAARIAKDERQRAERLDREAAQNVQHEQQMADKARREADKAEDVATKARSQMVNAMDEGAKIVARQQEKAAAARKKAVDVVDQGFTERAAAIMAENDLKLAQNRAAMAQGMPAPFPIARNAKEEQNLRVMGQPYALRPEVVGRDVQRRIAFDLGRTGQDVGLAPDITARGAELYRTRATEAQARTPMPDVSALAAALGAGQAQAVGMQAQAIQALADTFAGLQGGVNRNLQQSGRALQGVMGVQGNANRGRMHKPPLQMPMSGNF